MFGSFLINNIFVIIKNILRKIFIHFLLQIEKCRKIFLLILKDYFSSSSDITFSLQIQKNILNIDCSFDNINTIIFRLLVKHNNRVILNIGINVKYLNFVLLRKSFEINQLLIVSIFSRKQLDFCIKILKEFQNAPIKFV